MSATLIALSSSMDRASLATALSEVSPRVTQTASFFEARRWLRSGGYDLLFTEDRLPDGQGRRLARVGWASVMVDALEAGPAETPPPEGFIARIAPPFHVDRLHALVRTILHGEDFTETANGTGTADRPAPARDPGAVRMIGESRVMTILMNRIERVARADAPVLITGETGTGKEVAARTLHELSRRRGGPFVAVNCGAISPSLMESQLFGHERGSFTGATRRHRGVFERADGGTLFLDEITETPPELQVKLLRVLETGEFHRTGGEDPVSVNVRAIAATNRDVGRAVEEGRLREDLFYRLKVLHVAIPALRDRSEDIGLLATEFLEEIGSEEGGTRRLAEDTVACLREYAWPGNVRELRNAMHSAYLMSEGDFVSPDALPREILDEAREGARAGRPVLQVPLGTSIKEAERRLILSTLSMMGGNKSRTAEALGVSLKTLYNRLSSYEGRSGREFSEHGEGNRRVRGDESGVG